MAKGDDQSFMRRHVRYLTHFRIARKREGANQKKAAGRGTRRHPNPE
jgi:hypothetical protein